VLPKQIRTSRGLHPGDDFEIFADEDDLDLIVLRRIRRQANTGLVKHLSACPDKGILKLPARRSEPMRKARF
jgi:AbrB family looped-hinge helix DNA binding protein